MSGRMKIGGMARTLAAIRGLGELSEPDANGVRAVLPGFALLGASLLEPPPRGPRPESAYSVGTELYSRASEARRRADEAGENMPGGFMHARYLGEAEAYEHAASLVARIREG